MISGATITSMVVSVLFPFLLFAGLILFFRKKTGISIRPLIIGSIGFIVFTQILEKALHLVILTNFPNIQDYPWALGLYGGMAAGVFEEFGRFLLFIWLLKKFHDYKSGISFGIGWGGIEAVVIMLMVGLQSLIFAFMINGGTFETMLNGQIPSDQLSTLKESIISQGSAYYLLSCLERFFAVFLQIALSLFVLLAVVKKKFLYVVYAVLIHAAIDFPVAFYQTGHLSIWVVEAYIAVLGLLSIVFIKRVKKHFH